MRVPTGRLRFGRVLATPAAESSLPDVEACVSAARDYFRRAEGARSPRLVAADKLGEALVDARRRLYVLRVDDAPAGLLELALDTPDRHECTIVLLVLAEALRNRGLGREVASSVFDLLAGCGCARVRLGVAPGERGAAAFWTSTGMWACGREGGVRLFELPLAPPTRAVARH